MPFSHILTTLITLKLISFYPQVILAPCFIFFTFEWFGDLVPEENSNIDENGNDDVMDDNDAEEIADLITDLGKRWKG